MNVLGRVGGISPSYIARRTMRVLMYTDMDEAFTYVTKVGASGSSREPIVREPWLVRNKMKKVNFAVCTLS